MNLNNRYESPQDVASSLYELLRSKVTDPFTEMSVRGGTHMFTKVKRVTKLTQTITIELLRESPYQDVTVRIDIDLVDNVDGQIRLDTANIHEMWRFESDADALRLWAAQFITFMQKEVENDNK